MRHCIDTALANQSPDVSGWLGTKTGSDCQENLQASLELQVSSPVVYALYVWHAVTCISHALELCPLRIHIGVTAAQV